jgi:hypothetical protein
VDTDLFTTTATLTLAMKTFLLLLALFVTGVLLFGVIAMLEIVLYFLGGAFLLWVATDEGPSDGGGCGRPFFMG